MSGGLRFVFFSLMFVILATVVVILLVSDDVSDYFSETPESSTPTSSNVEKEKDNQVTRVPEPGKIPIAKKPENNDISEIKSPENADPQNHDVKPDPNYLSEDKWEKYRKIRENAGNLKAVLDDQLRNMRNYLDFAPDKHVRSALDEKSLEAAITFSQDNLSTEEEKEKVNSILNHSYNRDLVDDMLELLASSDSKLRAVAFNYFINNIFPELGDVIVAQLVANPHYDKWFSKINSSNTVPAIFQIFMYYADIKTLPIYLTAYRNYIDTLYINEITISEQNNLTMFNSFFAGITSYVPEKIDIIDATVENWQLFYESNKDNYFGLKRDDGGSIVAYPASGDMKTHHDSFKRYQSPFYKDRYPIRNQSSSDLITRCLPMHMTFVPLVLEKFNELLKSTNDPKYNKLFISPQIQFLRSTYHPVLAKEFFDAGSKKLENWDVIASSMICGYFSRVANFEGYGLKFAIKYLKKRLPIDENCRNMLIALDEPELIEYLLEYEKTTEDWASVMVRLTRKTFGSLGKDMNIDNWKKYLEEVLPE